ncbi:hypothetical protein NUSPORA_01046 [Nucleospora cyclopteri]
MFSMNIIYYMNFLTCLKKNKANPKTVKFNEDTTIYYLPLDHKNVESKRDDFEKFKEKFFKRQNRSNFTFTFNKHKEN